jgi:hypothetical protein
VHPAGSGKKNFKWFTENTEVFKECQDPSVVSRCLQALKQAVYRPRIFRSIVPYSNLAERREILGRCAEIYALERRFTRATTPVPSESSEIIPIEVIEESDMEAEEVQESRGTRQ